MNLNFIEYKVPVYLLFHWRWVHAYILTALSWIFMSYFGRVGRRQLKFVGHKISIFFWRLPSDKMFGGNCAIMSSNVKQTVIKKTVKQPMNTGIKMHHHFIVSGRVDKANSQNFCQVFHYSTRVTKPLLLLRLLILNGKKLFRSIHRTNCILWEFLHVFLFLWILKNRTWNGKIQELLKRNLISTFVTIKLAFGMSKSIYNLQNV